MSVRRLSRVTSFDVAALAGVSQSAVSRAFSSSSSIADVTRKKVLEAARKLNYIPNFMASSLTTKRTNIIALIVGDLENPFYVRMFNAFSERLQQTGLQVLAFAAGPDADMDAIMMRVLQYQVDGIIVSSARLSMRMTGLSRDRGIPVVFFNRYVPGNDASCVRCDNAAGGRLIAEAFLSAGARSFAMITGDGRATTSQDRVRGFVDRLRDAEVRPDRIEQAEGFSTYGGGAHAAMALFRDRRSPMPDAVFCINDIMAIAVLDVMKHRLGLSIPQDVMVAGFDDIPESRRLPYRLTTVRQPLEDMVSETMALLHLDDAPHSFETGVDRAIAGQLIWRKTIPLAGPSADADPTPPQPLPQDRSRN